MDEFFQKLEDEAYFCALVGSHIASVPDQMKPIFECEVRVDEERLKFAHAEYVQAVSGIALYLGSANPDHHKRAGALLHALHKSMIVCDVSYGDTWEEVEAGGGPLGTNHAEVASGMEFKRFFDQFHNEMLAFMFAFQCCDAYEEEAHSYSFDYLENMCAYLQRNAGDVSSETCYMIFKSMMERCLRPT